MISALKLQSSASDLGISLARLNAVIEVESGGTGMQDGPDGRPRPIILFEPHIFYQQLEKRKIDPFKYTLQTVKGKIEKNPQYADVLYRKWGSKPYPSGQGARWAQLEKATSIDREAALSSASYGLFQICGFNYFACGCKSLQIFVNRMYKGEDEQLELFEQYIITKKAIHHALKIGDFATFARLYNGPLYKKHDYDGQLKRAEIKFIG